MVLSSYWGYVSWKTAFSGFLCSFQMFQNACIKKEFQLEICQETPGADVQDESISRETEEDWSKKENSSVEKEKKQPARRRRGRAAPSSRRKVSFTFPPTSLGEISFFL